MPLCFVKITPQAVSPPATLAAAGVASGVHGLHTDRRLEVEYCNVLRALRLRLWESIKQPKSGCNGHDQRGEAKRSSYGAALPPWSDRRLGLSTVPGHCLPHRDGAHFPQGPG